MRVCYECTTILPGRSGIGHTTERLAHAIDAALPDGDELWMLTNAEAPAGLRAVARSGPLRPTPLWMQVAVPRVARRERFDLYHFTNSIAPVRFREPYVVTIHDLSLVRMPQTHPLRRRAYQGTLLGRSACRARRVLTISEASARDVVELLGVPRERVDVTPLGVDDRFRPVEDAEARAATLARHGLGGRYVLYVGNIEPRKNLERLVEAFALAGARDVTLALAGGLAWMSDGVARRVAEIGDPSRVRLLGYVPDADLPALYTAAEAFVYPSLLEGFGLPVLEAMACGAPVIASRIAAIEEVAGDAARLVDPHSVEEIAAALRALTSDRDERARLSAAGRARAARFSWAETARLTIEAYRAALGG